MCGGKGVLRSLLPGMDLMIFVSVMFWIARNWTISWKWLYSAQYNYAEYNSLCVLSTECDFNVNGNATESSCFSPLLSTDVYDDDDAFDPILLKSYSIVYQAPLYPRFYRRSFDSFQGIWWNKYKLASNTVFIQNYIKLQWNPSWSISTHHSLQIMFILPIMTSHLFWKKGQHLGWPWGVPLYSKMSWYYQVNCHTGAADLFQFFTRGQFWPSGIVVACVCPSVSPSVTKFVRAITHQPFKLGSPNLDQRCKRPWLRSLLFCGTFNRHLQGQIQSQSQNLHHFELVHAITQLRL